MATSKRTVPTHRCKTCGALWRLNPADPNAPEGHPFRGETWSVLTPDIMGKCCDQGDMDAQMERM